VPTGIPGAVGAVSPETAQFRLKRTHLYLMDYAPPLPFAGDDITGNPVQFVDLDGDGLPDMIYGYKDKNGATTNKVYLNVDAGGGTRRWSDIESEHPDLSYLIPPAEIFPLSAYGIGDMGVRFAKLGVDAIGVMVGSRPPGPWGCASFLCGYDVGQPRRAAYLLEGKTWKPESSYVPPIPFVTQYDTASGASFDLFVQLPSRLHSEFY
jgi:hypothetical protein